MTVPSLSILIALCLQPAPTAPPKLPAPPKPLAHAPSTADTPVAAPTLHGEGSRPLDLGALAPLRSGASARIALDLPRRGAVTLNLARTAVATDDFRVELAHIERGEVRAAPVAVPMPDAFAGTVEGAPGSRAFIGLGTGNATGLAAGFIQIGDETWWISSGPLSAQRAGLPAMIAHASALPQSDSDMPRCAGALPSGHDMALDRSLPAEGSVASVGCRSYLVALDSDTEYLDGAMGGNVAAATQYALLLLAVTDAIYQRDIGVGVRVPYLRLWSASDPWDATDIGGQLYQFADAWNQTQGAVSRHAAHFLSARGLGGGVAWGATACAVPWLGYAVSSPIGFGFPYPIVDHHAGNWEPSLIPHELGHNFGAPHTHDYTPPVDKCGLGDCTFAWGGTIMSYCDLCPGGSANLVMRMHEASADSIRGHLATTACEAPGVRAVDDSESTLTGGTVMVQPIANDFSQNCGDIELAAFDAVSVRGGTIALIMDEPGWQPRLRYTAPSTPGPDSFQYTVRNPLGATATGTVAIEVAPLLDRIFVDYPQTGLDASWYELPSSQSALPDFDALDRYGVGVVQALEYPSATGPFAASGRAEYVGAVFEGYLLAPSDGLWRLFLDSDDGSRLFVDGRLVVNNDGSHGMAEIGGAIGLEAGRHRLRIEFFQGSGPRGLIARWEGPGIGKSTIPASAFSHGGFVAPIDLNGDGTVNAPDLVAVLAAWGPAATGQPEDLSRDGFVNAVDVARVLGHWGE